ncbi:hypothetical protein LCGC14_0637600 [marine sediment metagenome]|uniref:Uncharacterized protein n=1 Tax=marine sediment metagenome TaxID=412755 RepID=A0A0F9R5E8_9ZZZZ
MPCSINAGDPEVAGFAEWDRQHERQGSDFWAKRWGVEDMDTERVVTVRLIHKGRAEFKTAFPPEDGPDFVELPEPPTPPLLLGPGEVHVTPRFEMPPGKPVLVSIEPLQEAPERAIEPSEHPTPRGRPRKAIDPAILHGEDSLRTKAALAGVSHSTVRRAIERKGRDD